VSDENGTDMRAVHQAICPEYPIIFTHDVQGPLNDDEMNYLFNSADVYINLASNEGFGLGSCEALTCGTPIVVNVTGGLQDQCGFKNDDDEYLTHEDYVELGSNHRGKYKQHGEWVVPVFPSNISCQGSPMTPYIFDDRVQYEDAGEALLSWYLRGSEERERCGEKGIEFVKDKNIGMDAKYMGDKFIESMDGAFDNWKPKEKYTLEVV
jgi:glycosyltransferase involved in cell wall biosynthesis